MTFSSANRALFCIAAGFCLLLVVEARTSEADAKNLAFFESRVRSVLVENCYSCHSLEAEAKGKLKGGLYLQTRGTLKDTLVVWAGEFARTPYAQNLDGRDHNNKGYSIWMAGGGLKGGLTCGATDEFGHKAVVNPMHLHDWHATILHLLGLDHTKLTFNYGGRDFQLTQSYGNVAEGILA
jgi:hypothetical protein